MGLPTHRVHGLHTSTPEGAGVGAGAGAGTGAGTGGASFARAFRWNSASSRGCMSSRMCSTLFRVRSSQNRLGSFCFKLYALCLAMTRTPRLASRL
jgi:hypothetical protein